MAKSIDEFVENLPEMDKKEAERIYQEALGIDDDFFTRVELNGAHELSTTGIQMVYVIGHGKINYGGEDKDSLFYFNCMVMRDFFSKIRDNRDVNAIPLERIYEIKPVQLSSEISYKNPTPA